MLNEDWTLELMKVFNFLQRKIPSVWYHISISKFFAVNVGFKSEIAKEYPNFHRNRFLYIAIQSRELKIHKMKLLCHPSLHFIGSFSRKIFWYLVYTDLFFIWLQNFLIISFAPMNPWINDECILCISCLTTAPMYFSDFFPIFSFD